MQPRSKNEGELQQKNDVPKTDNVFSHHKTTSFPKKCSAASATYLVCGRHCYAMLRCLGGMDGLGKMLEAKI